MIYTLFIVPLLMIICGFFMYKHPPRKPNWFIGYRTIKSMKNEKVWEKANKYCGKLFIEVSLSMAIISLFIFLLIYLKKVMLSESAIGIIILCQIVPILFVGYLVEKKLADK